MPKPKINLSSAEEVMDKVTDAQAKRISKMFEAMAKEVAKKADKYKGKENISSIIRKKYLEDLAKELKKQTEADFKNLEANIKDDMLEVGKSVVECIRVFEESIGMNAKNAWLNVPIDAVTAVATGKIYAGNWTLSKRIWGIEKKVHKDIEEVIAKGIAENMSAYDIAKDLERYVDPKARKDWNWSKVYPGTNKRVDYSAQRLARTMVSHAYQFSFVKSTKDNPFIAKYKWISSHDKRVCEICKERDGKTFDKDKLPLDHPNGRCTFVSVFDKSMDDIADELADWVKSPPGKNKAIDNWMKKRLGEDKITEKIKQDVMKEEVKQEANGKDITGTWKRREDKFQYEVEDIINAQGFDGLPKIVDADEFEAAAKKSKFAAQRIYSAQSKEILEAYRESLYTGKWYVDCSDGGSQFGKGMYCASDTSGKITKGIKNEMKKYKDINESRGNKHSFIETFTLSPDAKIIKYQDVIKEKIKLVEKLEKENASEEIQDLYDGLDEGSVAALLGYDAILVDGKGDSGSYTVILNRTKLIIKRG